MSNVACFNHIDEGPLKPSTAIIADACLRGDTDALSAALQALHHGMITPLQTQHPSPVARIMTTTANTTADPSSAQATRLGLIKALRCALDAPSKDPAHCGMNPLGLAVAHGHTECVRLLLFGIGKADNTCAQHDQNSDDDVDEKEEEEVLLWVSPNTSNGDDGGGALPPNNLAMSRGVARGRGGQHHPSASAVNLPLLVGETPLHIAAVNLHVAIVELLLSTRRPIYTDTNNEEEKKAASGNGEVDINRISPRSRLTPLLAALGAWSTFGFRVNNNNSISSHSNTNAAAATTTTVSKRKGSRRQSVVAQRSEALATVVEHLLAEHVKEVRAWDDEQRRKDDENPKEDEEEEEALRALIERSEDPRKPSPTLEGGSSHAHLAYHRDLNRYANVMAARRQWQLSRGRRANACKDGQSHRHPPLPPPPPSILWALTSPSSHSHTTALHLAMDNGHIRAAEVLLGMTGQKEEGLRRRAFIEKKKVNDDDDGNATQTGEEHHPTMMAAEERRALMCPSFVANGCHQSVAECALSVNHCSRHPPPTSSSDDDDDYANNRSSTGVYHSPLTITKALVAMMTSAEIEIAAEIAQQGKEEGHSNSQQRNLLSVAVVNADYHPYWEELLEYILGLSSSSVEGSAPPPRCLSVAAADASTDTALQLTAHLHTCGHGYHTKTPHASHASTGNPTAHGATTSSEIVDATTTTTTTDHHQPSSSCASSVKSYRHTYTHSRSVLAARKLLAHGASVNAKGQCCRRTALHGAVAGPLDGALVQLLLDNGADPDVFDSGQCGVEQWRAMNGGCNQWQDGDGGVVGDECGCLSEVPLASADACIVVASSRSPVVEATATPAATLIGNRVSPLDVFNRYLSLRETVASNATERAKGKGNGGMAQTPSSTSPASHASFSQSTHSTPLEFALYVAATTTVPQQQGGGDGASAAAEVVSMLRDTPGIEIAHMLLDEGADPSRVNIYGETPLEAACVCSVQIQLAALSNRGGGADADAERCRAVLDVLPNIMNIMNEAHVSPPRSSSLFSCVLGKGCSLPRNVEEALGAKTMRKIRLQ